MRRRLKQGRKERRKVGMGVSVMEGGEKETKKGGKEEEKKGGRRGREERASWQV